MTKVFKHKGITIFKHNDCLQTKANASMCKANNYCKYNYLINLLNNN